MLRTLSIPFIVYWLLVKDFFHNVDVCDSDDSEPGHCLSNSDCNNIGTVIGSCDSETSHSVCCKITFNYFNETYLLEKIFVRKAQTDVVREMLIFSSGGGQCGQSVLHYGNASILLKAKKKVYYVPESHVSETPDRIIWPVWTSYSRESRDLKRQGFGTNHLYVVELNKLVADESDKSHKVSECVSESDENDKFYVYLNQEKRFPIRKFFTQRMQKFNTMNLTVEASSFIEGTEPDKRSRRSVHDSRNEYGYLSCEKKQFEDVLNGDDLYEITDVQSELERSYNFFKQMDNSEDNLNDHNANIDIVTNYALKSKVVSKDMMEHEDIHEPNENESGNKISPIRRDFKEQIFDSSMDSKDIRDRTARIYEIPQFDNFHIIESSSHDLNPSVPDNMHSQKSKALHDSRKPVQVEATHDMRKPVQLDATHDMRKPVQVEVSHNLRKPVMLEDTHDMQKPVEKESSHNMRSTVQNNVDHNMRKPIETGRISVERESTHDMRKPVTSNESHDLRWPVLEGETDLRNVYRESDAYESDESKISDSIKAQKLDGTHKIENNSLDCAVYISLFSMKSTGTDNECGQNQMKQSTDVWEEALKVCGKYSRGSTETSSSKTEEQWPSMVSLHEKISGKYKHKCSAALLNSLWVITVAHCVDMKPKENILLVLGNQNSTDGKVDVTERAVDEIIIHPKFNRGLFENDLALLRMKTPVAFQSAILPICLPWNVEEVAEGIPVFLGLNLKDQRTNDLQDLTIPIMTNYECEILYSTSKNKEKIKDTFLCAGKDDRNCDSESGSSLIALDSEGRWSLIGLVSWGGVCTSSEQPGVYIRISSYSQWIKDVIDCYEIVV